MSCNPGDLLLLADELGGVQGCSEAQLRCSTSRCYYAALHSADQSVPTSTDLERQRGEGSHEFIIRRLHKYGEGANPGRRSAAQIAFALKKLKDQRTFADYRLDLDYEASRNTDALERARAILRHCDELKEAVESCSAKTRAQAG